MLEDVSIRRGRSLVAGRPATVGDPANVVAALSLACGMARPLMVIIERARLSQRSRMCSVYLRRDPIVLGFCPISLGMRTASCRAIEPSSRAHCGSYQVPYSSVALQRQPPDNRGGFRLVSNDAIVCATGS